jgi:hypothetical protein
VAVGGEQDVRGVEVEVGQTGGVGRLQGVEQLEAHPGHLGHREGAVLATSSSSVTPSANSVVT